MRDSFDRVGEVPALGNEQDDFVAVGANPPPHQPAPFRIFNLA